MVPNAKKPDPGRADYTEAHTAQNRAGAQPERRTARQGRPSGQAPAPRSADVAHAPPSAEPQDAERRLHQTAPPDNAPERGGPQDDPLRYLPAPDAGRGPYAPQRRSARQRSRDPCKTRRGPQEPPRGPSRRMRRAAPRTHAHRKAPLRERDALPSRSLALQYSRRRRA